jgi:hypothetical protein
MSKGEDDNKVIIALLDSFSLLFSFRWKLKPIHRTEIIRGEKRKKRDEIMSLLVCMVCMNKTMYHHMHELHFHLSSSIQTFYVIKIMVNLRPTTKVSFVT